MKTTMYMSNNRRIDLYCYLYMWMKDMGEPSYILRVKIHKDRFKKLVAFLRALR